MTHPRWVLWTLGHAAVCASSLLLIGCGSYWQNYREGFVRSGITGDTAALRFDARSEELVANPGAASTADRTPPPWVTIGPRALPTDPDNYYFVGRSIAYNVFDERAAYDQARDHVLEQIGKMVATRVRSDSTWHDERNTPGIAAWWFKKPMYRGRFLPGEGADDEMRYNMRLFTDSIAGDLVEKETYWEQWYLEEKPEDFCGWPWNPYNNRMKRYKLWVLMSMPKASVDKFFVETKRAPGPRLLAPSGFRLVSG